MFKQIAAASVVAVLLGYTIPASSQTTETTTTTPSGAPSTEIAPATPSTQAPTPDAPPAPEAQPLTSPATEAQPVPETPSTTETTPTVPSTTEPSTTETTPTVPSTIETTPTTPSETQPITPSTTPPTEVQPAVPVTPSTSTPSATPSAEAKPSESTAKTGVLESESITGIKEVSLPTPPVTPAFFTLPMQLRVVKDASITSNTPITDKSAGDLSTWAAAIRACIADKPAFVRVVDDQEVPFVVNGTEGKVRLNANDKPVCSA